MRSSSAPNIHNASMLNRMWDSPPCRNMYVASCHTQRLPTTSIGLNPNAPVSDGTSNCPKNTTTFAAIRALSAVDTGPGPKENDDAYAEGVRRIRRIRIVPHQALAL